jgi:hypothetical protein
MLLVDMACAKFLYTATPVSVKPVQVSTFGVLFSVVSLISSLA